MNTTEREWLAANGPGGWIDTLREHNKLFRFLLRQTLDHLDADNANELDLAERICTALAKVQS